MKWTWDHFGINREDPEPGLLKRLPNLILHALKLHGIPGVHIHFNDALGKAVIIVPVQQVNPTWQQIDHARLQSGWNVEVFSAKSFDRLQRLALNDFNTLDGISSELAAALVDRGYFTLGELCAIDPGELMQLGQLDAQQAAAIIRQAEIHAELMEI
jgi:hypothetical protein